MTAHTDAPGEASRRHLGQAAQQVGHDVLGPIFAEFAQRLWLFQRFLPERDDGCLLFCARGGLRLRLVYERFLERTGLAAPLPHADLMISRLVAARTSIAAPGAALLDELGREFEDQTMREVAAALAQAPVADLQPAWDQRFDPRTFFALLDADAPEAARLRTIIGRLDGAFRRHLAAVSGGRSTIVLCDTGLYGSTVRLLRDGIPERRWVAAQFARSNYKGFATPHFDITVGLSVERDSYAPWNARTTVLRFWQLIESALEPDLGSVRTFTDEPYPHANLEVPGWRERIGADGPGLFAGMMAYLDELVPGDLPMIGVRAERAWRDLRRLIIWPRRRDLAVLTLPPRARDFGRTEAVHQFPQHKSIRSSLWREGALVGRYPWLRRAGLVMLEAAHTWRTLRRMARRRGRREIG